MVFPSIRSFEEIHCLSFLDDNRIDRFLSRNNLPINQNNRQVDKIINKKITRKSLRFRRQKFNYPIAS